MAGGDGEALAKTHVWLLLLLAALAGSFGCQMFNKVAAGKWAEAAALVVPWLLGTISAVVYMSKVEKRIG